MIKNLKEFKTKVKFLSSKNFLLAMNALQVTDIAVLLSNYYVIIINAI